MLQLYSSSPSSSSSSSSLEAEAQRSPRSSNCRHRFPLPRTNRLPLHRHKHHAHPQTLNRLRLRARGNCSYLRPHALRRGFETQPWRENRKRPPRLSFPRSCVSRALANDRFSRKDKTKLRRRENVSHRSSPALQENGAFLSFPLCLSRACLGKMMHFCISMAQKAANSYLESQPQHLHHPHHRYCRWDRPPPSPERLRWPVRTERAPSHRWPT
eukprot:COSAG06_NODE_5993_length_3163_cov_11.142298_2_plen_214_part_00